MTGHVVEPTEITIPGGRNLTIATETVKRDLPPYWDRQEINTLLNRINNQEHQMLFRFLWMSGVRVTEAVTLRKQDIDTENFTMRVRWLKSRKYRERVVPVHPELLTLLRLYTAPMKAEDRVFPISRQRVWQLSKKYFGGKTHKFRHSFAVNWLRSGLDLPTLSRVLGHGNIRTTMVYQQIVPVDQGKELIKVRFD